MRPISFWQRLMSSTVSVADRTGADTFGKPTYGTAVSYAAHISRKRRFVMSPTGQQVSSEQSVHLSTDTSILPTARVTLSTGDVGSTESWAINPVILAVERAFDENGPHHTVLYL